jgi:hypothetical protein
MVDQTSVETYQIVVLVDNTQVLSDRVQSLASQMYKEISTAASGIIAQAVKKLQSEDRAQGEEPRTFSEEALKEAHRQVCLRIMEDTEYCME